MAQHDRIRWYNPKLRGFEWRTMPDNDEEALTLLEDPPADEEAAEVYREWRALGAGVAASLIRAGETARARDEG